MQMSSTGILRFVDRKMFMCSLRGSVGHNGQVLQSGDATRLDPWINNNNNNGNEDENGDDNNNNNEEIDDNDDNFGYHCINPGFDGSVREAEDDEDAPEVKDGALGTKDGEGKE